MNQYDPIDRIIDAFLVAMVAIVLYLKITGVITIPWIWLLAPIWGMFALGLILAGILTIIYIIVCLTERRRK